MSQLRCYSIVGDSNVRRHLHSDAASQGRPLIADAQFVPGGGRLSVLSAALSSVRLESDSCVVASLTNVLTGSVSTASLAQRVDPLLKSFVSKVLEFALSRPDLHIFVCPPMYRLTPVWYRDGLSEIMSRFSSVFRSAQKPHNLFIMPSFSRSVLEADGVHLTALAGIEYILFLFSASQDLINTFNLSADSKVSSVTEATRSLEDRVHVIEQDHAALRHSFELQSAISSELFDYEANIRNEAFFMIQGLPRLGKLDQKEWQVRALADVNKVLSNMGFDFEAKYIQNATGRGNESRMLYKVRLESAELSKKVRDKFSGYFSGGKDSRPDSMANLSVRNCVTPGTLARIAILQLFAKRYRDSNPGARASVIAYESRPLLRLTPAPEARDRRVMTFNFIDAVKKLPASFTRQEIENLMGRISPSLHGNLRSVLVVVSDDMLKKKKTVAKKSRAGSITVAPSVDPIEVIEPTSGSDSEFRTPDAPGGRKRGRDQSGSSSGPSAKK